VDKGSVHDGQNRCSRSPEYASEQYETFLRRTKSKNISINYRLVEDTDGMVDAVELSVFLPTNILRAIRSTLTQQDMSYDG
jgi:hypothetical protein